MEVPQILVGMRVGQYPPTYYLGFPGTSLAGEYRSVRALSCARLEQLESRAAALRDILATEDPELAQRSLCDGPRLEVTEVILRPETGRDAIAAFVDQTFMRRPS
jgi:hypothetical protein